MIVNIIVGFWLLLFGAMAVVPFMLDSKPHTRSNESTTSAHAEDRVISIRPVGLARPQEPATQTPASILAAASARASAKASQDEAAHRQAA
ncbi:MAG: hypothetical protein WBA46_18690 [Thermomicrobiales bacterium]